jgi:hypothetical protein
VEKRVSVEASLADTETVTSHRRLRYVPATVHADTSDLAQLLVIRASMGMKNSF